MAEDFVGYWKAYQITRFNLVRGQNIHQLKKLGGQVCLGGAAEIFENDGVKL